MRVSEEVNPENRFSGFDVTYVDATLSPDQPALPEEYKVLGVRWNVHSDQLIFELCKYNWCGSYEEKSCQFDWSFL